MAIRISNAVCQVLEARGLLPKHCRLLEITIPPAEPMTIRYEIFVTDETAAILADAFAQIAADDRVRLAREAILAADELARGDRPLEP